MRIPKTGEHVVYVDAFSVRYDALKTNGPDPSGWKDEYGIPWINVVFVSTDEHKVDGYGRQTERNSSVPHVSASKAPGMYWCWADEYSAERDSKLRAETMRLTSRG